MRIAIITPVYPPYRGGIGAVAKQEAILVREKGHDVTVFTPAYGQEESTDGDRQVIKIKSRLSFGNAAFLPDLLHRLKNFDIIHLHYPFYGADIFVVLASLFYRSPYVLTVHMRAQATDWRNVIFILHRLLCEKVIFYFAHSISVSSFDYAKSYNIHHKNLIEIPFGVDEQIFKPEEFAQTINKITPPTIIFVGGMDSAHEFKGVDVLIEALTLIPKEITWRAVLVGDGNRRKVFMADVARYGLDDRVLFSGSILPVDLPSAYQQAAVHVLPSTSSAEAFGLVTLEAAASGIPSIVTDLPGVRTLVLPEETGLIVPVSNAAALAQALARLLTNASLRRRMGKAARARVCEKYTKRTEKDALIAMYTRCRQEYSRKH